MTGVKAVKELLERIQDLEKRVELLEKARQKDLNEKIERLKSDEMWNKFDIKTRYLSPGYGSVQYDKR